MTMNDRLTKKIEQVLVTLHTRGVVGTFDPLFNGLSAKQKTSFRYFVSFVHDTVTGWKVNERGIAYLREHGLIEATPAEQAALDTPATILVQPLRELESAQQRIAELEAALKPFAKMHDDLITEGYDIKQINYRFVLLIVLNSGSKEEYTGCDLYSETFRCAVAAVKVEKAS